MAMASWHMSDTLRSVKPVLFVSDTPLDRERNRVVLHGVGEVVRVAAVGVFRVRDRALHLVLADTRMQIVRVESEDVHESGVHGAHNTPTRCRTHVHDAPTISVAATMPTASPWPQP